MSEKKIIDFETLGRIINIFKLAPKTNLNSVFDELPKPTLPDVCGTRKLDSMTEDEVREFKEILGCPTGGVIKILNGFINEDSNCRLSVIKLLISKGFNVFGEGK